jgi:type II secretory pathway pseudopilin PulG
MLRISKNLAARPRQRGVTLLEVVVIILVLVALLALITPAVQTSRPIARRAQCLNNLKNLALATLNDAEKREGRLVPLAKDNEGWPIELMDELDNAAVQREFREGEPAVFQDRPFWIEVFTCPDDENHWQQAFGLSYVANAGFGDFRVDPKTGQIKPRGQHTTQMDWTGDGQPDPEISRSTGVFWKLGENEPSITLTGISGGDGLSNTLLLAENLQAGNWLSTDVPDLGFVIDRTLLGLPNRKSKAGVLDLPKTARLDGFRPNANPKLPIGKAPRPSSNHDGIFHAAFCDGRAKPINEDIDPLVYARLLTWNGQMHGEQALNESELR